jgi:MFS family permease
MVLVAAFLGWLFDGFEIGLFPVVARPALLSLLGTGGDAEVGWWMGCITACFSLGAAAGGVVFGWLGDRIGRVRAMAVSILTYSLFTGLSYFAQTPAQLGVLRFVGALGMGGEWSLGVALVMECWPEKWRPALAGAIGAAANVGFLLTGVVAYLQPVTVASWRWMFLVGALPAFLVFFIILAVPESERWKRSVTNQGSRPVREIIASGLLPRSLLAIVFASVALIGTWGSVQWLPLWADKMAQEQYQAQIQAAAPDPAPTPPTASELSPTPNARAKQKADAAKATTQMLQAIGAIFGCLIAPWIGARLGRRIAFFLLCLSSLALCWFMFKFVASFGAGFLVLALLVSMATASFYGWFPLYFPELFPTRVRATGQGLCYNFGRVFAAGGALVQGQLVAYFEGSYPRAGAVVTLIYLVGMIMIWFAPETKGKPLPE